MKPPISILPKVYHLHLLLKGKEAHHIHPIMDKEIIITMGEDRRVVVEEVVPVAHHLVVVQQEEAWTVGSSNTQIQQIQIKLILTNPEVTPVVKVLNQTLTVTIKPVLTHILRETSKILMTSIKILLSNRHGHNRHNNRKTLNNFLRHKLKLITVCK